MLPVVLGQYQNKYHPSAISSCKNPKCVRCQRYRQVQQRARMRLTWILHDLKARDPTSVATLHPRVPDAVRCNHTSKTISWQNPTVLMVHGLPSKEIVTSLHKVTCQYLREQSTRELVMSALQSTATPYWTVNDSPEGHWEVLHLLNQGTWNKVLFAEGQNGSSAWNDVLSLVRNIPGLMNECLFGNVMISKIHSGTTIEPHCGPTNVRHRLQFLLEMASEDKLKMSMLIGRDKQVFWNSVDNIFVFDDSYVHSVTYPQTKNGAEGHEDHALTRTRTVLIVDLWNPYLSLMERLLLQQLYPPFATQDDVKSS